MIFRDLATTRFELSFVSSLLRQCSASSESRPLPCCLCLLTTCALLLIFLLLDARARAITVLFRLYSCSLRSLESISLLRIPQGRFEESGAEWREYTAFWRTIGESGWRNDCTDFSLLTSCRPLEGRDRKKGLSGAD
ncbi:hypothetical protein Mapa_010285 [Marchantia paleacea]|nr:hypothetical protein Mapa_010285 [Marchantia paleacea]